jgi:tocopherol O-methyltransferase
MANSAALLHSLPSTASTHRRLRHRASAPKPAGFFRRPPALAARPMGIAALADASSAPPGLNEGIAGLYDESSGLWENIWGEHMHHGFYILDDIYSWSLPS